MEDDEMKVLGISFGRRNQRCDVMVKEALFAAKAAGAEVRFINTIRMDIGHCRACDYCSRLRDKGEAIKTKNHHRDFNICTKYPKAGFPEAASHVPVPGSHPLPEQS